jgi:hypothetical protein
VCDTEHLHQLYPPLYQFGYGKTDCKVYPYWEANQPVSISGQNAKALVLQRGAKAMIVLTSFDNGGTATLKIDTVALGLHTDFTATNAETHEPLALNGNVISLDLPMHDVRLIAIE